MEENREVLLDTEIENQQEENKNDLEALKKAESEELQKKAEIEKNKKSRRKKIIGYVSFILINILVVGGFLLFEDKTGDVAVGKTAFSLLGDNIGYTVLMVAMFFVIILCDVIVFYSLTAKLKVKNNLLTCINVSFFGRYYDRVTPWAMGGEPFQIAYLCKHGHSVGNSGAVTMSRHIIRFFTVAVAVILILCISQVSTNIYVMLAAIISVLGGLVVPTFMLICAFKPKVGQKITDGVIKLLVKIKLVKDPDKIKNKVNKNLEEFLGGIKYLSANKYLIVIIGLCSLVEMFAYNSVPFFTMKALGVEGVTYWHTLVLCLFVNYASSFAPTPGGAGIAELSFYAIFASYVGDGLLFWAVLFWRISVFYIPVFIGFFMQLASSIRDMVLLKKGK
ncbi:MAG: flippase-like domain-containing protein [Clostridia bacterium]|nr:flippase-like domain-containing protein [Clostridia bacterium]